MLIEDFKPEDVQWCEVCAKHVTGQCDNCQSELVAGLSYRSQSFHFHPSNIDGSPAHYAITKVLCRDCYLKDFASVYPNHELPDLGQSNESHEQVPV